MEKRSRNELSAYQSPYQFDDQGANYVSEQIMNAYNNGVIDQENGQFDMEKHIDMDS